MNSFIFVATGLSTNDGTENGYSFNGKWYPTIILSIIGLGLLYYFGVFAAYVPSSLYNKSLLQMGNVRCAVSKEPSFEMENELTRRFGQRRSITITVSLSTPPMTFNQRSTRANNYQLIDRLPKLSAALFWFFGGHLDHSPLDALEDQWTTMKQNINTQVEIIKGGFTLAGKGSQRNAGSESEGSRPESEVDFQMHDIEEGRSENAGG